MLTFAFILITLVFVALTFLVNFFGKKIKEKYLFWAIPSLFFVIYFVFTRFWNDWGNFSEYLNTYGSIWNKQESSYSYSIIVSKALLLDMCPFVALALPISLIVDKSRRSATAISPYAILGGTVTIPYIYFSDPSANLSLQYLFLGKDLPIYFLMHFYLVVYGTMVLSNSKKFKWTKQIIEFHVFGILYFIYIIFVAYNTNVTFNVTGVVVNDWISDYGEYTLVKEILHLNWPWVLVVGFLFGYLFMILIVTINILWKYNIIKKMIKPKQKFKVIKKKVVLHK